MRRRIRRRTGTPARLAPLLLLALAACGGTAERQAATPDWPGYGGTGENHYAALDQIDAGNVGRLGLAWFADLDTGGSSLTAPVAVGGVVYVAAGLSVVHAFDARTGKLMWRYDPEVGVAAGHKLRAAWGSRGLAYAGGRIFVGTVDGRLIAIDAKTGLPAWSVMTVSPDDGRYISGAPWVFRDKVVIGHGGADFASVRGYVTAYDQKTGRQAWRFHTVPGDPVTGRETETMRMAAKSWTGEWWRFGGGGTVWNAMAYDPEFNRIYIGTGNGAPWNARIRSPGGGDNLFVCSIVALDADTGRYVWHYQVNPGETWDYNAAMDMNLAELTIDGRRRKVLMQAPKNGFFYVIDRETGKPISATNFVPVNWARGIDIATGRPIENPAARFPGGKPAIVYPSPFGAHNIEAMSFNPATGLAYIPAMDQGRVYVDPPSLTDWRPLSGQRISNGIGVPPPGLMPRTPSSFLVAWNPVTQKEAWRVAYEGTRGGGGTATTAGNLLFQGRATGRFVAMAADTGRELWSFDARTAVMAQPISYMAGGRQYVTVVAGARFPTATGLPTEWNYTTQRWRVLTFALDAKATLPPNDPTPPLTDDPAFRVELARAAAGAPIYAERCAICHGAAALSGGAAPDLLRSPVPLDADAFAAVLDGALMARGMPRFEELSADERQALVHYIRQRARQVAAGQGPATKVRDDSQ